MGNKLTVKEIFTTAVYNWLLIELFITVPKYVANKKNSISNPYINKKIFHNNPLSKNNY